jgi:ABC-type transporter MlaC component
VKHIESVDNTKTSTNNIPIAKQAEKQVNLNQIKSVTKAENLPILNENPTHDLILTEVSKSTDNNEFKENISKEASLTDLVLSNLENQKTQYKIDPDELLKIVESEIEKEKDKRFRDKVIDKVKSTMTDLNIAIK